MTVVPETNRHEYNNRRIISDTADDDSRRTPIRPTESSSDIIKAPDGEHDVGSQQTSANSTSSNIPVEKSDGGAILGTRRVDPDDRLLPQQQLVNNDRKKSLTQSDNADNCDAGLGKPANFKLQQYSSTTAGANVQQQNE